MSAPAGSAVRARRRLTRPGSRTGRRLWPSVLWLLWIAIAGTAMASGFEYYATPQRDRAFAPLHEGYAPTGPVGHSLGVVGTGLLVAGVASYSARKRMSALANVGRLRDWLDVHIFLCTLGPFLVLLHTSFKFGGIVAIAFWSMAVVVVSGVFGRYLYVHIPKTLNGRFLSLRELNERRGALAQRLAEAGAPNPSVVAELAAGTDVRPAPGLLRALVAAVRFDAGARRRMRRVRHDPQVSQLAPALRRELETLVAQQARLEQSVLLLAPFQRMFRYWHVFHLPLALLMFAIVAIHVLVAVLFGYGWPF